MSSTTLKREISDETEKPDLPDDIISMRLSFDEALIVLVKKSSLQIWWNKPYMQSSTIHLKQETIFKTGHLVDSYWLNDGLIVGLSENGFLIFFEIAVANTPYPIKTNVKLNKKNELVEGSENYRIPTYCFTHMQIVKVEAPVSAIGSCKRACLAYSQDSKELYYIDEMKNVEKAVFEKDCHLPSNLKISAIELDDLNNIFIRTDEGSLYMARYNKKDKSSSVMIDNIILVHYAESSNQTVTSISVNLNYFIVALALSSKEVLIYSFEKDTPEYLQKLNIKDTISMLSWTKEGDYLAVGTTEKGLYLWEIFSGINVSTFRENDHDTYGGCDNLEDDFVENVEFFMWTQNDTELIIITRKSSKSETFFVIPIIKSSVSCYITSENIKYPTLYTKDKIYWNLFQNTHSGGINPNLLCHTAQIPLNYLIYSQPIRYISRSNDGLFIAIAGKHGFMQFDIINKQWKSTTQNTSSNDNNIICQGGLVWYKEFVVVACFSKAANQFQIQFYRRDLPFSEDSINHYIEIEREIVYINMIDNCLLVYTKDNLVTIFEIMTSNLNSENNYIQNIVLVRKTSLADVVRNPTSVKCLFWFYTPSTDKKFLENKNLTLFVLSAGTLLMFIPYDIDESKIENQLCYKIIAIAKKTRYFCLLDQDIGTLRFHLWAYTAGSIKIWYELIEDDKNVNKTSNPGRTISFEVPFTPIFYNMEKGLIYGVEQSIFKNTSTSLYFNINQKSYLWFHKIISQLIEEDFFVEALQFAKKFTSYNYFKHGLEILLHEFLELEFNNSSNTDKKLILPRVIDLIKNFGSFLDITVQCLRKTETAMWPYLFDIVGNPQRLFEGCLESNNLQTAASYLIVIHAYEKEGTSNELSLKLLNHAFEDRNLEVCKDVIVFLKRITGQDVNQIINQNLVGK